MNITKHRTVMELDVQTDYLVEFRVPAYDPEDVDESIVFGHDLWTDMGSPMSITVTIEPGDLLNGPGES